MLASHAVTAADHAEPDHFLGAFALGRRLHALRKSRGLTLADVATQADVSSSQLSMIENGKREAKVTTLQRLGALYGVGLDELTTGPPSRRTRLEVELQAAMRSPLAQTAGLPGIRISPRTPTEVLEAMVALHRELERQAEERVATPEAARRANTELRHQMRERDNHFPEIEREAANLLSRAKYAGGPLTERMIGDITDHLGFTLAHVADLPASTRSVTDLENRRIYLSRSRLDHDPRSVLLQALGHQVLGHEPPRTYGEFLRQRVETNYFAAALMLPESAVVDFLSLAKTQRDLAIEDLRDAFAVSYEAAAHRFTNIATVHLGLPLHFFKVHQSGTIYKAYENDGTPFPADHTGAIEGQLACRWWTARQVFEQVDTFSAYHQYTDAGHGTFWCTAHLERAADDGTFAVGIGVSYKNAKWFRGRDTHTRLQSSCPDPDCCRQPPQHLRDTWSGKAWPSARAHSHLLAALPPGTFPGVDDTEVYAFLSAHAAD